MAISISAQLGAGASSACFSRRFAMERDWRSGGGRPAAVAEGHSTTREGGREEQEMQICGNRRSPCRPGRASSRGWCARRRRGPAQQVVGIRRQAQSRARAVSCMV